VILRDQKQKDVFVKLKKKTNIINPTPFAPLQVGICAPLQMPSSSFCGPVDAQCGALDDISHFGIGMYRSCGFIRFCWEGINCICYAMVFIVWAQLGSAWSFLICRNFASGDDTL